VHCPEKKCLFSGDVYLKPDVFFFRSDEDYDAMTHTFEMLLDVEEWDALLCGHVPVYENGRDALKWKWEKHVERGVRIEELHAQGYTEEEISAIVFPRASKNSSLFVLCGGDVSPNNIIRSKIHGPVHRSGVVEALKGTRYLERFWEVEQGQGQRRR
jgi:hypothetical protein